MEINPVKGTHDIVGNESIVYEQIESTCMAIAKLYCYKEIRTPIMEHTPLFLRSVGESSDIVTKEMYTFEDKGGRSLTLRPEMTAGVMRSIVTNKLYANADLPLKYCYIGPCFRYERPQAGRYRQFHQFGVEAVGAPSYQLDAEVVSLGQRILNAIGIDKVVIKINSLGDEESRNKYRKALKEYFSKHIDKMCPDCKRRLEINPLRILDCKVPEDIEIVKDAPKLHDYLSKEASLYLQNVIAALKQLGIETIIDDTLVRGLDYYTGVVWEYHMPEGSNVNVGALGGGGHYANLLSEIGGPSLEGVGLSLGLERLATVVGNDLEEVSKLYGPDFFFIGMTDEIIEKCFCYADHIRSSGKTCEVCYEVKSMKSAFKMADRKNAKFVVIVGEDEIDKKQVTVKNMRTQEQTTVALDSMESVFNSLFDDYVNSYFAEMAEKEME